MFSRISAKIKQLDRKLFFTVIAHIEKMIENIVDKTLYINLLFLFTIGFFLVSAGAFLIINNIPKKQIIHLIHILISRYLQISGTPININIELTKHIQLFVACNPNAVVLSILNNIINNITSLNIPKNKDNNKIIITLENVK